MATIVRGQSDDELVKLKKLLDDYEHTHPGANAELYRQNSASIRVRIVDEHFRAVPRQDRKRELQSYLQRIPEDLQQQITLFLLLPPDELKSSLINQEFEDPIPSSL